MSDLAHWLEQLGLGKYAGVFADNDIDLRVLPKLTDEDLKELGVSPGHRRLLQTAISELGDQSTATPLLTEDEAKVHAQKGDGLLAYFDYPRAHEDDAERTKRETC